MKKKLDKEIVWFIILALIFLLIIVVIPNRMGEQSPSYSVLNKSEEGYSLFYEALKEHDYPVERALKPVTDYESDNIQIITDLGSRNGIKSDNEITEWVRDGGILVLLSLEGKQLQLKAEPQKQGVIIKANAAAFTNSNLLEETDRAYRLLMEFEKYNYEKIYFNEHNLFVADSSKTLWDIIPLKIKVIIYQLIIVVAAFFYYQGKRFGKPRPFHSEIEREENEYIYSAAALYRQAGCWDLLLKYYYNDFLKRVGSTHDSWLEYWRKNELPSFNEAKQVYEFMDGLEENLAEKRYKQIITILEELKEIIKKRRDSYWKKIKRNM